MIASNRRQTHMISTDTMNEVATTLAQRNAMDRGGLFLAHGCRLFPVLHGWESAMLMRARGVKRCDTLLLLEAAIRDPEVRTIFISSKATMTDSDIERICHRNGVAKNMFREVLEL
jgi:hypothetical protein